MITRRSLLGAAGALCWAGAANAVGPDKIDATELGLLPRSKQDQSITFQKAIDRAAYLGLALFLPYGAIRVHSINLPDNAVIIGTGSDSILELSDGQSVLQASDRRGIRLESFQITGPFGANEDANTGLIMLENCSDLKILDCHITTSATNGIVLNSCAGRITDNTISGIYGAAIASRDGRGMWFQDNLIHDCANLGVYVDRAEPGFDGSIITGNRISRIDWVEGGNGQNGNGINAFRTGGVVISDNVISDCAFSAVRLNATENCQVTGNICRKSGEVAIFSEFGFSGSIVANNIVDQAATGISITNLDEGGRLAVCSGNIVRNIAPKSMVNPDTTPVGIAVEADTVVNANVVEIVPGVGISLGWGPHMRNLTVSSNVVRTCDIAIGVSVVEGGGAVNITGNLIQLNDTSLAIAGMEWDDVTQTDLIEHVADYAHISLSGNHVAS